jgi:general secretion pathway protein G
LIEVLLVIVILGIMAAIVVPQFVSAADESRHIAIKANLRRTRTQLEIYKQEHQNPYPTMANIVDQLTLASKSDGSTASVGTPGFKYGPYLHPFLVNPANPPPATP